MESMNMAVSAVRYAGVSLHEAAKTYCVPYTTLRWRVKNDIEGECRRGRKPALSKTKEDSMVDAIVTLNELGFGLSRKEVSISYLLLKYLSKK